MRLQKNRTDVFWSPKIRDDALRRLHESHQGISKCRERDASAIWWLGISRDITRFIDRCDTCRRNRPTQREQPLRPVELPGRPWEKVAMDIFHYNSSRTNSGNLRNHGASLNIPQTHIGMAERAVQTAKRLLDLDEPEIGLLNYHASLHSAIGISPAVALMGRQLATRLPVVREQLSPRQHRDGDIRNSDQRAKTTYVPKRHT